MIVFEPLLPWVAIAALGGLGLAAGLFAVARRARGGALRLGGFLALSGILLGPQYARQTRQPLPDVALLVVDRSDSMNIGNRAAMANAAVAALRAQAARLPDLLLRVVQVPAAPNGGTALFGAAAQAAQAIPAGQLAGVVLITDGQIDDVPATVELPAPLAGLLTAKAEQTDRELRLLDPPAYGLAGQNLNLRLEIFDHGRADAGAAAAVSVSEDGAVIWSGNVAVGQAVTLAVPVRHAGPAVVAAAVSPLPGEVSTLNDQAAFTLTGIARRLRVLLVSGNPDQSERGWRGLLKSDPAVQLVHFTILRTPDEALDAAPADMALVPFPVEQLFETDIGKFDLIILDEFSAAGLLPPAYLGNIAAYVRNGGALLVETGPEYVAAGSLALSPLAPVLPATPVAPGVLTQPFSPLVTALGARHPVTSPFAGRALAPWQRLDTTAVAGGDVLMTGADNWPLLVLAAEGKGRTGMLLSDQFWLWTRGGAHAGPALPLLRLMVHWLLREPALEADALNADFQTGTLVVRRGTLGATYPGDADVTAPDGHHINLPLETQAPGLYGGQTDGDAFGVWKVAEGGMVAFAARTPPNAAEFRNLAASAGPLRNVANIVWLGQTPAPDLTAMLRRRHASLATGTSDVPLLPPLPAAAIVLALLAGAWWRERR